MRQQNSKNDKLKVTLFLPEMSMSEEEELSCRFCLEEGKRIDFIAPCNCAGSSRWVHRACLDKWRSTRDKAFSQCTECKAPYDIVCITNDTWNDSCLRWTRFSCYFIRDLLLLIIASQLVILLMSSFVYLCDMSSHSLLKMSEWGDPYSFYYLAGLALSLSIIGMIAVCFRNQVCGECARSSPGHCCYSSDILFPFYIGGNESPLACNACCGPHCGELCCAPCANGCTCAECTAAGCGQEMLAVLFVVFIILAIIGVFVSVLLGVVILQHMVRRHVTVLHRWNLTKEYIVRDLAPGGLSNEELLHAFSTSAHNRHEEEAQDESIISEGISLVHSSYSLTRRGVGPQGYTRLDGGEDIEAAAEGAGGALSPRSISTETLRTASLTMSEDQRQLLVRNNLL